MENEDELLESINSDETINSLEELLKNPRPLGSYEGFDIVKSSEELIGRSADEYTADGSNYLKVYLERLKGDKVIEDFSLEPEFSEIDQEKIIMLATKSFKLSYNNELACVVYVYRSGGSDYKLTK
jgi:hypothetical protein